jgi:hypothetical protein
MSAGEVNFPFVFDTTSRLVDWRRPAAISWFSSRTRVRTSETVSR